QFKLRENGRPINLKEAAKWRRCIESYLESNNPKNPEIDGHGVEKISDEVVHELYGKLVEKFSPEVIRKRVDLYKCDSLKEQFERVLQKAFEDKKT
ncbi:MAG: hypothetical protein KBC67_03085, partial [Candidatus Pacebacteria bacterium]|nr:hypothetical protein [Candidatus Paceibacterota bacterium]